MNDDEGNGWGISLIVVAGFLGCLAVIFGLLVLLYDLCCRG